MTSASETVRIALAALLVGIAIPLLVQLYLVLRGVRRTVAVFEQRLDGTLRDLGDVVADLKRVTTPAPNLALQVAAAVPAVLAAVRAFRTGVAHDDSAPQEDEQPHTKEKAA